jgi:HlyD family secretion protein
MSTKIAFSEKALEQRRLTAPSHALTSARTPWTWFLLGSVTLFFLAMIVWGFYGSMVESVRGVGVTLLSGGVRAITAGGNGILSHLNVQAGAYVSADQIVGQIYNPERLFTVRKLEAEFERLSAEADLMQRGTERLTTLMVGKERDKVSRLERLAALQEQSKKRARELGDIYAVLSRSKTAPIVTYYQTLDRMLQTELDILSTYFQSAEASVSTENLLWQQELKLLDLRGKIAQKKEELWLAKTLYREADWLTASFDGQVMEVLKEDGAFVQAGDKVALVGADRKDGIYLAGFVSADQGQKIRTGMSAYFAPAVAPASQYGYIKCVVRDVSTAPVNAEMVLSELMNASLTQQVMGKNAVMRVELEMVPDAGSASGFRWTSSKGYPREIVNGMVGEILVNTEYRTPASYLIPALRELMRPKAALPPDGEQ